MKQGYNLKKMCKIIENNFTHHKPSIDQTERYDELMEKGKNLALIFNDFCPDSREKSLAMTKIEEAIMWAKAAIARN